MSVDLAVSVSVLAGIVVLSETTRRLLVTVLADTGLAVYAVELVSTFQLCACTHELKLLAEVGRIEPRLALTLTYLASVVHALTCSGAVVNPTGTLARAFRNELSSRCALRLIACQFAAACAARAVVPVVWTVGLSDLHLRHKLLGFRCLSPIRAPLPQASALEFTCAFTVQTVISHTRALEEKYRVHVIAAVTSILVYTGGSVTGAVFNPALAFSTQFRCSGNTFPEYCLVYWLGPVLGMTGSVLLFDKVIPRLSSVPPPDRAQEETRKRK
ncbi:aquaporin-11 [Polymixia lowei]